MGHDLRVRPSICSAGLISKDQKRRRAWDILFILRVWTVALDLRRLIHLGHMGLAGRDNWVVSFGGWGRSDRDAGTCLSRAVGVGWVAGASRRDDLRRPNGRPCFS